MKLRSAILCLLCTPFTASFAQQASLEKKWTSDTTLRVPESVYVDAKRNVLYASSIDGAPWARDGQGFISRLSPEGKVLQLKWVEGMNCPKGMGIAGDHLFVADLDALVEIDIAKGVIVKRHVIDGAQNLNDVAADPKGNVYVSDSKRKKVHVYYKGNITTVLDSANSGLRGPNGLLCMPSGLLVLDAGSLYRAEKDGKLTKLATIDKGTDGIEHVKGDEFVVSCWQGEIFYVNAKTGTATKILDTQAEKLQTADIGYDLKKKIVYVPTFYGNRVVAYQLNVAK